MHTMPEHSNQCGISQLSDISQYEKVIDCYMDVINHEEGGVVVTADKDEDSKPTIMTSSKEIGIIHYHFTNSALSPQTYLGIFYSVCFVVGPRDTREVALSIILQDSQAAIVVRGDQDNFISAFLGPINSFLCGI